MTPEEYRSEDAVGLLALLRSRAIGIDEVLDAAHARYRAVNPTLNAVARWDVESARSRVTAFSERPLAGLPTLLKDLNTFKTGWPATQGSRALADKKAGFDSFIVERLERSGASLVGQTTSPELGLSLTTESPLWGIARNPFDPTLSPGGSSGGAAAAVAAGIVPFAQATDSAGSIRIPAAHCGLFGLKPSRGRIPAGPDTGERMAGLTTTFAVTRSVRDAALLVDLLHGPAPGDPYSAPGPDGTFADAMRSAPLPRRIALCPKSWPGVPVDAACWAAAAEAASVLEELGATIYEAAPAVDPMQLAQAVRTVIACHLATAVERLAAGGPEQTVLSNLQPVSSELAEEGARLSATAYLEAVQALFATARAFGRFFLEYDLWITPSAAAPPPRVGTFDMNTRPLAPYLERFFAHSPFSVCCNSAGVPAASVPIGWLDNRLPIGAQLVAPLGGEARILRAAALIEEARPWKEHYSRCCG